MKLLEFNQNQRSIIEDFKRNGGVVDFFIFQPENDGSEYNLHKDAALKGLELIQAKIDRYYEELISQPKYKDKKRDDFFKVTIESSKLEGKQINLEEFIGCRFDLIKHKLLISVKSSSNLNNYFWAGEDEKPENIVNYHTLSSSMPLGFADAFVDPPYPLEGSAKDINKIFIDVKDRIFEGFDVNATIYSWSTNCSSYFDDGHEWWGAYFYTYQTQYSNNIVVVLASSTD